MRRTDLAQTALEIGSPQLACSESQAGERPALHQERRGLALEEEVYAPSAVGLLEAPLEPQGDLPEEPADSGSQP